MGTWDKLEGNSLRSSDWMSQRATDLEVLLQVLVIGPGKVVGVPVKIFISFQVNLITKVQEAVG
jgi:hypothetical protein